MEKISQKYDLSFEWRRSPSGYRWEDCEPCDIWGEPFKDWDDKKRNEFEDLVQLIPNGPYLTKVSPRRESILWKPLDDPALFAKFADIEPDAESFLNWADEHGRLLGVERDLGNHIYIFSRYIPEEPIEEDVFFQLNI
ncbi:MAG: hypothetical protein LBK91_06360, partial [Synergistaceae bacterium]|nr:hypothetical protein [Synergistaceae bacterium]